MKKETSMFLRSYWIFAYLIVYIIGAPVITSDLGEMAMPLKIIQSMA